MELAKKTRNGGFLSPLWSEVFDNNRFFETRWPLMESVYAPPANVIENGDHFKIELAVPGYAKEDFTVMLEDDVLTISAEKEQEAEEKETDHYIRREFAYAFFSRSFTLPQHCDGTKAEAHYDDGILSLAIPKREPENGSLKKEIPVR
jgi:HSP20 family protein